MSRPPEDDGDGGRANDEPVSTSSDPVQIPLQTHRADQAEPTGSGRRPSWPWWLLRLGLTAQAALILAQPIIIGRFLDGDFAMLNLHRSNGTIAGILTMGQIVVTLAAWLFGGAPRWLFALAVLLGAAIAAQLFAGFNHLLGIHLPLGVAIVGVNGWLLTWVWQHGPRTQDRP